LSPAKVSQVRITDLNNRQMEVLVQEDQLSLAIGKKGQNVRLAARLVGWDIKIVSEEVLKKEIAKQMGRMMASGEAVPITALEVVTAAQAETLSEKGVTDVESLAATSVDDLVEFLDVSLDVAEAIIASATSIVAEKNAEVEGAEGTGDGAENETAPSEESTAGKEIAPEADPATELLEAVPSEEIVEAESGLGEPHTVSEVIDDMAPPVTDETIAEYGDESTDSSEETSAESGEETPVVEDEEGAKDA